MAKKYAELRAAMPQEAREKAERMAEKLLAEIERAEMAGATPQGQAVDSKMQMPFPPRQMSPAHATASAQ